MYIYYNIQSQKSQIICKNTIKLLNSIVFEALFRYFSFIFVCVHFNEKFRIK